MSKSVKSVKRGRPPVQSNRILLALKEQSNLTAKELGTDPSLMGSLVQKKLVTVAKSRMSGQRGRPAAEYRLTLQGHNRVRSIQAQHVSVEA